MHIALISASVRDGRRSHRVALHHRRHIEATGRHTADLIDLHELGFPLFHERLSHMMAPDPAVMAFAQRVRKADGVIIITPEYNGGCPASLKNVIDLLTEDWRGKPVALCAVSDGAFGGTQAVTSLLFTLWKIRAWVVPGAMHVPQVSAAFDVDGTATEPELWARRTNALLESLEWAMEAVRRMRG